MRLLSVAEIAPRSGALIVRQSRVVAVGMVAFFIAFATFGALFLNGLGWPWFGWIVLGVLVLFIKFALSMTVAAFRETNWTLRLEDDRLLIKFRSYLNRHFPDDAPTVIELRGEDLISAGRHEQKITQDTGDGTTSWKQVSLDLALAPGLTEIIDPELAAERRRRAPKIGLSRTKSLHYFVSVPAPDVLRVIWRGKSDRLTPAIGRVLEALGPLAARAIDTRAARHAGPVAGSDLDAQVLALCESGEVIAAVKMLREHYGYSLAEARRFVDDLVGKAA